MPDVSLPPYDDMTSHHSEVANNARELYRKWIQPTDFCTNTNLLAHMLTQIIE